MEMKVVGENGGGHRLRGDGANAELSHASLTHVGSRALPAGTVRGYAFDLLNPGRLLGGSTLGVPGPKTRLPSWTATMIRSVPC